MMSAPSFRSRLAPAPALAALGVALLAGVVPATAAPASTDDRPLEMRLREAVSRAGFSWGAEGLVADPTEVDWRMLAGLNYRTGEMTDDLKAVVGGEAKVPGFMVPLEDYLEQVSEFLLVPYVGACVHTPPPPPNQLVYVKMPEGQRATVEWWDPIYVVGTLVLEETENVYGSVSYTMEAQEILPYEN